MTAGIAAATANGWVDGLGTLYAQLHTGDPGAAGTANASLETTRKAMTFGAAAGGSATQTGTVTWTPWAAGAETETHVSYWTALTSGTFKGSFALAASKPMTNGDTLNLSGCQISVSPIAA
jgi:hypothetical protein